MVNTEHMQQWIDALRSGEYTKTTLRLETAWGNCAMGVACREALKDGVEMRVTPADSGHSTAFDGENTRAPQAVLEWLGLDYRQAAIGGVSVIHLNDSIGQTFAEIADGLYQQYLKEPEDGQH